MGSMGSSCHSSSKWQWGPVARPVAPTWAMACPYSTVSPALTNSAEQWA